MSRGGLSFDVGTFARIPRGTGKSLQRGPLPATWLPPGEVAILFLSHRPGVADIKSLECPITPAVVEDAAIHGPGGRGVPIAAAVESNKPIGLWSGKL